MPLTIQPELPPLRVDDTGTVRVGKTRVLLDVVIQAFHDGATPEMIVQDFDSLELSEVYDTIGFYLRHLGEVDEYLGTRGREAEELRNQVIASQGHMPDIRQRLLTARAKKTAS